MLVSDKIPVQICAIASSLPVPEVALFVDLQQAEVLESEQADDDEEEHLDDQVLDAHDRGGGTGEGGGGGKSNGERVVLEDFETLVEWCGIAFLGISAVAAAA
jgi:hypothetical protein